MVSLAQLVTLEPFGQLADHHAGAERHAFGLHLLDAAVDVDFSILKSGMP